MMKKQKRKNLKNKKQKKHIKQRGQASEKPSKSKNVLPTERELMDFAVHDMRLKIMYFIPHAQQDLEKASLFGMYTPGLHAASEILSFITEFPADVREPFASPVHVLHMRLRRLIWRHVLPIDIHALEQITQLGCPSLFRVVLTNDEEIANAVDQLKFSDDIPFLHASSVEGKGRLSSGKFNLDELLNFISTVLDHLQVSPEKESYIKEIKSIMNLADKQKPRDCALNNSYHNVTQPNEAALVSYGWLLNGEDPLVKAGVAGSDQFSSEKYIDRICLSADMVFLKRQELMKSLPKGLADNSYIITVPSIHWFHYQSWRNVGDNLEGDERIAIKTVFKNAVQQSTYFDTIVEDDAKNLLENKVFMSVIGSKSFDQRCYTSGLSLLSSATLTPVLRLEPRINRIRGEFKVLAHCVRSDARKRAQFKQSRLARVAGQHLRDLIDQKFLDRIDLLVADKKIQGIKLVTDVPLEWLHCEGVPLTLRFNVSRIPILPGNLFLSQCIETPIIMKEESLYEILVIRSFRSDDQLKPLLKQAIDITTKEISKKLLSKIDYVDVETEDELVNALNKKSYAILIFDGHGYYESNHGVGTFVVGGKPIEVWGLRERCSFPPVVIFSACDTHPIDGSHGSCAMAAFTLGAKTVLATSLPVDGRLAAIFIARLILRIFVYVPIAVKTKDILTWRDVISGMLRMTYASEVTRLLIKHEKLQINLDANNRIQLETNLAINNEDANWYEVYLRAVSTESELSVNDIRDKVLRWASMTDTLKYIQLGNPENIIITSR